jgi:hypothetical protein
VGRLLSRRSRRDSGSSTPAEIKPALADRGVAYLKLTDEPVGEQERGERSS